MRVVAVIVNLPVADVDASRAFYTDFLGLREEDLGLGWVTRFSSPSTGAQLQVVTQDATAPERPVASLLVDDVEEAYEHASRNGYEIVHPLTSEPWGVTRFFVRAPDGNVLNIAQHRA